MSDTLKSVRIEFEFTPLGDLFVIWKIPVELIKSKKEYKLEVPAFKYDLPRFLSVPVPFSSKAHNLEILYNIKECNGISKIKLQDAKYSNKELVFKIDDLKNKKIKNVVLKYNIKGLMNADGVYFVAVYPFKSFLQNINHRLKVNAKFSFNIRKYRFWERYFLYPNGKGQNKKNVFEVKIKGDELVAIGNLKTEQNSVLDIHITGTRLPFFIRRDYFWISIFIFALLVFLSPFVSEILNLFTCK